MIKKLYHGAAYYPELWNEETINQDISLMKEAGINVVRMGEFAWSTMEPHQDEYNLRFFASVIKKLYENGIEIIMCTPTATPPVWISYKHPERMIMDESRTPMSHGGRQQVCTNNSFFRERARLIIEKMAEAYGNLPGVIGWQLDNELKGNVSECYCDTCRGLWHKWLENKYGNIDNLNEAWGTHIWSQYYETFEQVPQPFKTPVAHNPSLSTAYRLFSRDYVVLFVNEQVEIIRRYSKLPITHNSSLNHFIDNEKTFENLDFASFDQYATCDNYSRILTHMDIFKTLKKDKPYWVMETAPSFSGYLGGYQTVHNNGYIKAEAAAAYALGAEGFCYWLWRQHRSGCEQPHGAVINSWGKPSVGFKNVVEVKKLKDQLESILARTKPCQAELAVTYSDRARVFFMAEPFEWRGFDYQEEMIKWYNIILDTNIHRDLLYENRSFNGYKILMSPYLPNVSDEYISRAMNFVEKGGTWIIGPLTGIRTVDHTVNTDNALGKLEVLAGVKTVYHYPMTGSNTYGNAFEMKAPLELWSSVFECVEAKVVGITEGGVTPDMPFITECNKGKGKIVMLGSMPYGESGIEMLRRLIKHYAKEAGVSLMTDVTSGTIVVPREGNDFKQWVIINMDGKGGQVTLPSECKDALSGEVMKLSKIFVEPYGCRVMEFYGVK